jgi:hypothetical protein
VARAEGRAWQLADIEVPQSGSYLILESITKEPHCAKTIHVLTPQGQRSEYTLGRSHAAVLEIRDPTVSRVHAIIEYNSGSFGLKDNFSKFGTLVLLHGNQPIVPGCLLSLQISKTLLTFALSASSAPGSPRVRAELSAAHKAPALYH